MPSEIEALRAALKKHPQRANILVEMAERGMFGTIEDVPANEHLSIVCADEHCGIVGAKRAQCACGASIWLSPSTQETILQRPGLTTTICIPCAGMLTKEE
jgi:hypothetical protein